MNHAATNAEQTADDAHRKGDGQRQWRAERDCVRGTAAISEVARDTEPIAAQRRWNGAWPLRANEKKGRHPDEKRRENQLEHALRNPHRYRWSDQCTGNGADREDQSCPHVDAPQAQISG